MALAANNWLASEELGNRFLDVRLLRAGLRFTIYEGREASSDRRVVIKVPDDVSANWLHEVVEHEATALAAAGSHPHVVTLYQQIALDDGRPALILERCTGSLADRLRGGERMSLQESVAIGIKLAGALETVHQAGFLHLDVRPPNILVSECDEPVLAGFDESIRIETGRGGAPLHVTTPHTAPELLEGNAPSEQTDVYGLASTLYELLAGQAAFREYVGESPATVIVRVLSGQVKPIMAPGVPLEMSDLLTWALSPEASKRPPTPAWMAEELARIERHQGWPRTRLVST